MLTANFLCLPLINPADNNQIYACKLALCVGHLTFWLAKSDQTYRLWSSIITVTVTIHFLSRISQTWMVDFKIVTDFMHSDFLLAYQISCLYTVTTCLISTNIYTELSCTKEHSCYTNSWISTKEKKGTSSVMHSISSCKSVQSSLL